MRNLRPLLACIPPLLAMLCCSFALADESRYATRKGPGIKPTIVRHPPAADFSRGEITSIPKHDPAKAREGWQVDLRSFDVRKASLKDSEPDLLHADFDSKTRWPEEISTLKTFVPDRIMELGRNPGLGLRSLHAKGITGKGVGIAIIDQALLVDHAEYKDRLRMYEEIHCAGGQAQMHGPAVASIAVGRSVGVAPGANLYYIAETHGTWNSNTHEFKWDFTYLAQSIDRILQVNKGLPRAGRIRVISISVGWDPRQDGYAAVVAAVQRARKAGIFVVSSSLSETYADLGMALNGLGRDPLTDPNLPASYGPGIWWASEFYGNPDYANRIKQMAPKGLLYVPMDSRCTASPTGVNDYVFYRNGGWSWSIPYIAGLYALACQVDPAVNPATFWKVALATGDSVKITKDGKDYSLYRVVNPAKLIEKLRKPASEGKYHPAAVPFSCLLPFALS